MSEFAAFGDPDRFEVGLRWRNDSERRSRRPAHYGWSVGDLRIVVAGKNLTGNARGAISQSFTSWYLLPIADWLADNWVTLLHQEGFAWHERSAAPAAVATNRRLDRLIDARDPTGREEYAQAQAWRQAHALRTAAGGGLLPDLFLRRYMDLIEASWTTAEPAFAPDGFRFTAEAGVAYLPVQDVAAPLWDLLDWVVREGRARVDDERDAASLASLDERLRMIERSTILDFAAARMGRDVASAARAALEARGAGSLFRVESAAGAPAAASFSPAVAMFGGLAPNLTAHDVGLMAETIVSSADRAGEREALSALVADRGGPPLRSPFGEGQELALGLIEREPVARFVGDFVDVEGLLDELGVTVRELRLDTREIRGAAVAGEGFAPTIVVNATSGYNDSRHGERFTLAHELAHLLYDRSLAVGVGMATGPWAPRGVEMRANAFAAMFLMPRVLVVRAFGAEASFCRFEAVCDAAERLRVGVSALIEHLANLELVTEYDRDSLRRRMSRSRASPWDGGDPPSA